MIVVKIMGGLGNQMFQYAAGRALAFRHETELVLDISFYGGAQPGCTPRQFQLDHMRIGPVGISRTEIPARAEVPISLRDRLKTVISNMVRPSREMLFRYREQSCVYNEHFKKLPDNVYLDGYWQSERYFAGLGELLRREFVPEPGIDERDQSLMEKIENTNSVSVHVRRGDYVTSPRVAAILGTCEPAYYYACMEDIRRNVDNPHFFIFSDDSEWVRRNLSFSFPVTIVDGNRHVSPVEDMRMMSLCRHNIIANSSFSWWGAWLNDNPEKIVYAPKQWFASADMNTEVVPERWKRL